MRIKTVSISKSDEKFYTITHKNDVSFIDHSILDETKNYLQFFNSCQTLDTISLRI